jgi:class 3 adenylate cyclase
VICLDPRGLGASDPVPPTQLADIGDIITDILAVLDALEVERVVLTGEGSFGTVAIQLAASHPERVLRLALANSGARGISAADYPIGFAPDVFDEVAATIGQAWGTGAVTAQFAPALASDPSFLDICARRERLSASPRTAEEWVRAAARHDVRDLLPRVSVPTLVYFTGDLLHMSIEHSRHLAANIPGAILVEAPGRSFYQPDDHEGLGAWAEFILGGPGRVTIERKLATVLFTDVIGSTERVGLVGDREWSEQLDDLDEYVATEVGRHGGHIVKQTGDGHLVIFDSPGSAVRAALLIARRIHVFGVEVRCGLHTGEIEVRPDGDIAGITVHTAARIMSSAGPRQVFVSGTVADLAAGAELRFEDRGLRDLKGVTEQRQLYEAFS